MDLLISLLIILAIIIFGILFLILYIMKKVKHMVGHDQLKILSNAVKYSHEILEEESSEPKSVIGMTSLVLPQLEQDFPEFNVEMLYQKIESNLLKIFHSIETKTYIKEDEFLFLESSVNAYIDDLKNRDIQIRYDNVVFHKHALKQYIRKNGIATLITSSTLEYDYSDGIQKSYKKQTRYTCKFVYVYDYTHIPNKSKEKLFVLHCPNCGAPLDKFKNGVCRYCMSQVGDMFLKSWKMISYQDDYQ